MSRTKQLTESEIPTANLFIGGEFRSSINGNYFDRLDPATDLVASRAACGRISDAELVVAVATSSFENWSTTPVARRAEILLKAKALMPNFRDRFEDLMLREIGATREWVDFNINVSMEAIQAAVDLAINYEDSDQISSKSSYIQRQPAGVCLAIAPWNAPIALGMRSIAFPLAFGNTVIFKASELSPATHSLLAEVFSEAGLPNGVLGVITNAPEHSEEVISNLIANPAVRRVNFTGSTRVGKIIAEICARNLKRCLLELGGKSPMIVLKDADLDLAVREAIFGAFLNQGQICMATDRIIIESEVADKFIELLKEKAKLLVSGDPRKKGVKLGPVASPSIAARLSALIEDAINKGAKLIVGTPRRGQFIDATLLDNITPMMRIYSEECFGPIAGIYRVDSHEEAITVANNCEYGLSSSIFTQNIPLARSIASRLEVGMCHVNSSTVNDDPTMPFGGIKSSGYGRFGSGACIDEFTELRWTTINKNN